jgi:NAD(P)-dependent dehydrogenase (short-subunit alcohol dehydrogenase family)
VFVNVLVTGAASGIGKATTEQLLAHGYDVYAIDIDGDGLTALPDDVETYRADVADDERIAQILTEVAVDVVINCAGYYELGAIEDMDADTMRNHFQTNVFGMLNVTRHALPQIRRAEGRIVNVSSLLGRVSLPFFGVYAATKHSVEAVSEALRYELAPHDVEVVVVAPGPTDTGLNERARRQLESYESSPYASRYADILQGDGLAGVDPARVARTVVSAVEADSPRNRYPITLQSRLAPTLQRIVPDALWNRVVTLLIDSDLPIGLR